jgi:hypothetical protein
MTCERFEERLIAGEKPNDDAALAGHVGSCLRCFRTASDMREAHRLGALMRQTESEAVESFDPGPRFWQKFPGEVSSAWMRTRLTRVSTTASASASADARGWRPGARLAAWLRRPLPAAMSGAVCAAGLALLVMGPGLGGPERLLRDPSPAPLGGVEIGVEDAAVAALGDEAMAELDLEGLASLRDEFDRALGRPEDPAPAGDWDEVEVSVTSDPTRVVEELEMLDETGLLALQEGLRQRI